jgi:hypothetical protein
MTFYDELKLRTLHLAASRRPHTAGEGKSVGANRESGITADFRSIEASDCAIVY